MSHPELHRTPLTMCIQTAPKKLRPLQERHSSPVIVHQLALLLYWQSSFQSIGTKLGVHPTGG